MVVTTASKACLKASVVAGGAGSYTAINLLESMDVTETTKNVDLTRMEGIAAADAWTKTSTSMLKSASFKGSGFFDYFGDTTGQKYVMDNVNNGALCWLQYFYGTGTDPNWDYVKSNVMVTDFTIKTSTKDMITFSFTAESTGTVSHGQADI